VVLLKIPVFWDVMLCHWMCVPLFYVIHTVHVLTGNVSSNSARSDRQCIIQQCTFWQAMYHPTMHSIIHHWWRTSSSTCFSTMAPKHVAVDVCHKWCIMEHTVGWYIEPVPSSLVHSFIHVFSISEIHQSGYRICHYNSSTQWVLAIWYK
jgi:hypothetical protein